MNSMRRPIALVLGIALAAGCFYGVPDLESTAGQDDGGSIGDSAIGDAGGGDGGDVDGDGGDDGGNVVDAAVDAGPTYCTMLSPAPFFCDDFDSPLARDPSYFGPISPITTGQVSPLVDNGAYLSAPSSLHFTLASQQPSTRLLMPSSGTQGFTLDFEVRIVGGTPHALGGLVLTNGVAEQFAAVGYTGGEFSMIEGATFSDGGTSTGSAHPTVAADVTTWVHLVFTLSIMSNGSKFISLTVNGTVAEDKQHLTNVIGGGTPNVALYGDCTYPDACEVRFDNVVVNQPPL
jgi:hypothetical protein